MRQIQSPFAYFTDVNGESLDAGQIYIGTVGANAESSPIAVYWDEAGTQPAAQPLRTSQGYIVNGVTNARAYIGADDYSMIVKDRNGQVIASVLSGESVNSLRGDLANTASGNGAELIGYSPDVTYPEGTVGAALRNSVSVTDYASLVVAGDWLPAFVAAFAVSRRVFVPPNPSTTYNVSAEVTIPDGGELIGAGWYSRIVQTGSSKNVLVSGHFSAARNLHLIGADESTVPDFTKQAGVYASNKRGVTVEGCIIEKCSANGVMLDGCTDYAVEGNRIFACKYVLGSGSDITLYSGTSSGRARIVGNHCLSNNSQGIYVDSLGKDADLLVTGNVCVTLDPTTCTLSGAWSELASGSLIRRHGIVVGYNSSSVNGPRAIIAHNLCRNTLWTGIYKQGISSGPVDIVHNQCSNNGYAAGNALSGGIYAITDGMTRIEGNTITSYQGDSTGAITLNATTTPTTRTIVRGNRILSSVKYGIFAGTNVALTDIAENEIRGCAAEDIFVSLNGGSASVGGFWIDSNDIVRSGADARSIYIDLQASSIKTVFIKNRIKGTGLGSTASIGIEIRLPAPDVDVIDNDFDGLYYAVKVGGYITGGRLFSERYERNRFDNVQVAWGLSSTGTTEVVPLVGNIYNNVTLKTAINAAIGGNACGYVCDKQSDSLTIYGITAAPAVGTWAIGDRAVRVPAVGSPKAWLCTTAGAPGTWTSEGDL